MRRSSDFPVAALTPEVRAVVAHYATVVAAVVAADMLRDAERTMNAAAAMGMAVEIARRTLGGAPALPSLLAFNQALAEVEAGDLIAARRTLNRLLWSNRALASDAAREDGAAADAGSKLH